jgi:hypothetical protein
MFLRNVGAILSGVRIQKNNSVIYTTVETSNFSCVLISKKLFG